PPAIQQTDAAAEKGDKLPAQAKAERVLVRSFKEECPLFQEEKRKAREVDLAGVDFGFGEVGVGGKDRNQLRRHLPDQLAAACGFPGPGPSNPSIEASGLAERIRRHFDSPALLKLAHAVQRAGAAQVVQK